MILKKLLSPKLLISLVITIIFAFILKIFYFEVLHIVISSDKLDWENFSYTAILVLFKTVIRIVLDEYTLPYEGKDTYKAGVLSMDSKPSNSGSSSVAKPGTSSGSGPASGTTSGVNTSEQKAVDDQIAKRRKYFAGQDNLSDNLHSTLKDMLSDVQKLRDLKSTHKLGLFSNSKGDLEMDIPNTISDKEAFEIRDKVSDLDASFIGHSSRYDKLVELDSKLYKKEVSTGFNGQHSYITGVYKDLFNK